LQPPSLKLPGSREFATDKSNTFRPPLHRETFWEIRGAILEFAGFFQPTKSMSYMNFRVLWQSPRSCMLL